MTERGTADSAELDKDIRQILLASDLTAFSDRALDRAGLLARQHAASLHIVHVFDLPALPKAHVNRTIGELEAQIQREVLESGLDPSVDVSIKILTGNTEKSILDEAERVRADLIVMGIPNDASFSGAFRGTTADRVVRRAKCPVLVTKRRGRRQYSKAAVAVDLAEPSRRALDLAVRRIPDAELFVVHVDESVTTKKNATIREERRHQIEDLIAARVLAASNAGFKPNSTPKTHFGTGKPVEGLKRIIEELEPELVVMGTHGRTGVGGLLLGSVAEGLLENARNDMLIVQG